MPNIDLVFVFVTFVVLLFSLTVHEAAHAWTADRFGDPTARLLGRISLNPAVHIDPVGTVLLPLIGLLNAGMVFGWAKPVPVNTARLGKEWKRKYMLVAAAGPASNIALAVVASLLLNFVGVSSRFQEAALRPLAILLYQMVTLNVILAVFNMLPVPPLDGGNVLAGLLRGRAAEMFDRLRPYGFLIIIALLFSPVLTMIISPAVRFLLSWLL